MNEQSSSPIFLYQHILCFQFLRKPPNHPHHLFHRIAQILPGGCRFIASSSEQMERRIGKKASIPASLHWMASGVTQPEKAKTGLPYFLANLATAMGAFPIAVCPSRRPSPVMTISLSRMNDSREFFSTIEGACFRTAFI